MYFSNSHASRDFPIPAIPVTETRCALRSSALPWKSSLTMRSSRSRPTNGGSRPAERWAPPRAASTRSARWSAHRLRLPLQLVLARRLVRDRRLGRALRRLADEHGPGLGRRLDTRRRVHEVAGDHSLADRTDRHRRLAGQHPRPRGERGVELGHGGDEVERSPHRALGVVLVRDRASPTPPSPRRR